MCACGSVHVCVGVCVCVGHWAGDPIGSCVPSSVMLLVGFGLPHQGCLLFFPRRCLAGTKLVSRVLEHVLHVFGDLGGAGSGGTA